MLSATLDALAEVGFEALSVADVARRAQTTPPAIYRRHANKLELVQAALAHELTLTATTFADQGSLRADLLTWVESIADALTPQRTRILAGLVLAAPTQPALMQALGKGIRHMGETEWATLMKRAIARGELPSSPTSKLIERIPGALVMNLALTMGTPLSKQQIHELVDDVLLPALLAPHLR